MDGAWRLWADRGIRVGTASWTEKTLIEPGLFYPVGMTGAAERLRFYAERFPLVEVDATYYALPAERNAVLWAERTPDDFVFNVKAFSLLTRHPTRPTGIPKGLRERLPPATREKARFYPDDVPDDIAEEIWTAFLSSLAPLEEAGKLGAVLFQFPEWFTPTRANREYLVTCRNRLAAALPGAACAIEFRSAGWMADPERQERTLTLLEEQGLPFVCVDMPQGFRSSIPPVAAVTAPLALVRFHGRRAETWGTRGVPTTERFRYDYDAGELAEWVPRIDGLAADAREVHVLMNNCYRDYAVRSAGTLVQLMLDAAT